MRAFALLLSKLVCLGGLASILPGCGGTPPPPRDPSDTASASKADGSSTSPPASAAPVASGPPAPATPARASATPTPADDSGDIKPAADDDPWMAFHQMAPLDVMKTMRGAQAKVQACWKAALKQDPSAAGEVKVRFVVTNDGLVRAWRDDGSSMSDGDVTQCVGELVHKLKFPKQQSPGDAWAVYSIHLSP